MSPSAQCCCSKFLRRLLACPMLRPPTRKPAWVSCPRTMRMTSGPALMPYWMLHPRLLLLLHLLLLLLLLCLSTPIRCHHRQTRMMAALTRTMRASMAGGCWMMSTTSWPASKSRASTAHRTALRWPSVMRYSCPIQPSSRSCLAGSSSAGRLLRSAWRTTLRGC